MLAIIRNNGTTGAIVLFLASSLAMSGQAIASDSNRTFVTMMQQMMTFFELLRRLSNNTAGLPSDRTTADLVNPWSIGTQPYDLNQPFSWAGPTSRPQIAPWQRSMPWDEPTLWPRGLAMPPRSPLPDWRNNALVGNWLGSNGALFAVKNGLARLFYSEFEYQDFFVQTSASELALRSAKDNHISVYKYALQRDKLILKNQLGITLRFRRIARAGRPDR